MAGFSATCPDDVFDERYSACSVEQAAELQLRLLQGDQALPVGERGKALTVEEAMLVRKTLLALFLLSQAVLAEPYPPLSGSDLKGLPYSFSGQPAFHEMTLYRPAYFCRFSGTPVKLAVENESQMLFQKLDGIMGVSRDPVTGQYYVNKLAAFQVINKDGSSERRTTRRVQHFAQPPLLDTAEALVLESDEKAEGSTDERTTRLEFHHKTGVGSLKLSLWKGPKTGPSYFEHVYNFDFQPVGGP